MESINKIKEEKSKIKEIQSCFQKDQPNWQSLAQWTMGERYKLLKSEMKMGTLQMILEKYKGL